PTFLSESDTAKDQPLCQQTNLDSPEPWSASDNAPHQVLRAWLRRLLGRLFRLRRQPAAGVSDGSSSGAGEAGEEDSSPQPHVWPPAHYTVTPARPAEPNLDVPLHP